MRCLTLLLLLLPAIPVAAQPTAATLLDIWQAQARDASKDVRAVRQPETLMREIDGPRGTYEVMTVGTIELSPMRRPRRSVVSATVNGEDADDARLNEIERRLRHALGPAARDLRRPAALAVRTLYSAEASGSITPTLLGSSPTWQLSATRPMRRGPAERLTAWFTPSRTAPRLLQLRRERSLPEGGTLTRVTTYTRSGGLDVPRSHTVDAQIEQRRRLRTYTLVLRAEASYGRPDIERE